MKYIKTYDSLKLCIFFLGLLTGLKATQGTWFLPLGSSTSFEKCNLRQLSADGSFILDHIGGSVYIFGLKDREFTKYCDLLEKNSIINVNPRFFALSPNGKNILTQKENNAFLWNDSEELIPLDYKESWPLACNINGKIIIGSSDKQAAVWEFNQDKNTYKLNLIDLTSITDSSDISSTATAITPKGDIITGWIETSNQTTGFYWTLKTGTQKINHLSDGKRTYPLAISSDGTTIVGKSNNKAFKFTLPRLSKKSFNSSSSSIELGTLPDQKTSQAKAVTADGSIIIGESGDDAFIWTEKNGMQNLQDFFINKCNLKEELKNWRIHTAHGISDDGLSILGAGINPEGRLQNFAVYLGE